MNIQAISFNKITPKINLSFRKNDSLGGINWLEEDMYIPQKSQNDPLKMAKAQELQIKSLNVLSQANSTKKNAKTKYAQAKKIYKDWEKNKPEDGLKDSVYRQYQGSEFELKKYIQSYPDGSKCIIKYIGTKPAEIIEIKPNEKRSVYYYYPDGKLERFVDGQHEKNKGKGHKVIIEKEFFYNRDGVFYSYYQNQQRNSAPNWCERMEENCITIDTIMSFDTVGKKQYLSQAKTGIAIIPGKTSSIRNIYTYDKDGKLIKVK